MLHALTCSCYSFGLLSLSVISCRYLPFESILSASLQPASHHSISCRCTFCPFLPLHDLHSLVHSCSILLNLNPVGQPLPACTQGGSLHGEREGGREGGREGERDTELEGEGEGEREREIETGRRRGQKPRGLHFSDVYPTCFRPQPKAGTLLPRFYALIFAPQPHNAPENRQTPKPRTESAVSWAQLFLASRPIATAGYP